MKTKHKHTTYHSAGKSAWPPGGMPCCTSWHGASCPFEGQLTVNSTSEAMAANPLRNTQTNPSAQRQMSVAKAVKSHGAAVSPALSLQRQKEKLGFSAHLKSGPTGSVLRRKMVCVWPAAPMPVTARSAAMIQYDGAARLASMEAATRAVARNMGLRLPQRSHMKPNRPEPRKAPMKVNCRTVQYQGAGSAEGICCLTQSHAHGVCAVQQDHPAPEEEDVAEIGWLSAQPCFCSLPSELVLEVVPACDAGCRVATYRVGKLDLPRVSTDQTELGHKGVCTRTERLSAPCPHKAQNSVHSKASTHLGWSTATGQHAGHRSPDCLGCSAATLLRMKHLRVLCTSNCGWRWDPL
jgi:hypothetical protein